MTHTIQLPDGRDLAYTEHGPRGGHPVLFFHGSRYYRDGITTARLVTFPEDAHLSILSRRGPSILRALRDRMQPGGFAGDTAGVLATQPGPLQVQP